MRVGHNSHIGRVRKLNQDAYWVGTTMDDRVVLAIADGLGGHRAGEVASQMMVDAIAELAEESAWLDVDALKKSWIKNIHLANRHIYLKGRSEERLSGMGTTLTMMIQSGPILSVFHAGDTRLYRLRDGSLKKLTRDHSMVETLLEAGEITPEEAKTHPKRNMLMQAIGTDERVELDVFDLEWIQGDVYLLCSDGLTNYVEESTIRDILMTTADPVLCVEQLIDAANAQGGGDNITAIIYEPEVVA
jgi:protein phosphatase